MFISLYGFLSLQQSCGWCIILIYAGFFLASLYGTILCIQFKLIGFSDGVHVH